MVYFHMSERPPRPHTSTMIIRYLDVPCANERRGRSLAGDGGEPGSCYYKVIIILLLTPSPLSAIISIWPPPPSSPTVQCHHISPPQPPPLTLSPPPRPPPLSWWRARPPGGKRQKRQESSDYTTGWHPLDWKAQLTVKLSHSLAASLVKGTHAVYLTAIPLKILPICFFWYLECLSLHTFVSRGRKGRIHLQYQAAQGRIEYNFEKYHNRMTNKYNWEPYLYMCWWFRMQNFKASLVLS